ESAQSVTSTICPYCGVGCAVDLHVQDNQIVKVTSPMDSTVTEGHLCIKGRFGFEFTNSRSQYQTRPCRAGEVAQVDPAVVAVEFEALAAQDPDERDAEPIRQAHREIRG